MTNKHPTINITVSDKRVERNPRAARPMEDRTHTGKVRSRPERNPRSVTGTVERSTTFIAKLRSRTCCNDEVAASRRGAQSARGTPEIDKLLAQRYGQVRLVPSRVYSYRNPYDLRDTTSCQSGARRRTVSSGIDPRFRRTIRVVDANEGKETDPPRVAALNSKERPLPLVGPAEKGASQGSSTVSVAVQATSRSENVALEHSSSSSVAVQTQHWPFKIRSASARREAQDSGRIVKLKRSSSDTTLHTLRSSRHRNRFRHSSEGRESDVNNNLKEENNPTTRCQHCCQYVENTTRPTEETVQLVKRTNEPTGSPVETCRKRKNDAAVRQCKHCGSYMDKQSSSAPLSGDLDQSARQRRNSATDKERVWSRKVDTLFPPETVLVRRVKREGYVFRAVGATVRMFLVTMILLSLAWFLFVGMEGLREWWSPPDAGWADTCKWFVLDTLRRITILEKCKCT